ncbi:MAG: PAS domain S-box protein [Ferrovibrio sp.]|uniref:sensor histidine kinase n=1 Tax=Ferrovibrio sp. TaxID=1917215 RepID=UPI002632816E|nr:PAS domain S-box protein [Ferrovibrio sp.]MCW0234321.1 PAS domain S-box protein [Ferrovibrio sp.]
MDIGVGDRQQWRAGLQPGSDSEATLNSIIEHSPSGMALATPQGRCLRVNRALCDLLGYTPEEFYDLDFRALTHPDDIADSENAYRLLNDNQTERHHAEKRYRRKDGSYLWAAVVWSAARSASGTMANIVVQITDITAHKQHEAELEELAEYLRLAIQASQIGIWSYDFESREFIADARVWELWGRDPLIPDNSANAWMARIHPEDRDMVMTRYKAALDGHGSFETEHRVVLPNGRIRHIRVQSVVQRHEDGRPRKLIGTNADETDRIEMARYLQRAKDEAEAANRAKSMFLANMSHELRTPLNAIIGFSDAMKSGIVNVTNESLVRSYSADIHASGQHLLGIINDLLDLSRIESGKFTLNESSFDLRDVINDVVSVIRREATAAGLRLDFDIAENVPAFCGDERAVRQIMFNLLSNAVKFTQPGGCITCGLQAEPRTGLRLWVSDTGIGIAAADIPRLMQPFAQIDNVYKRQFQGAGLGLAIVRSLVEMHGGAVGIASTPGKGTTVNVMLPADRMIAFPAAATGAP